MKVTCMTSADALAGLQEDELPVLLFGRSSQLNIATTGAPVKEGVVRHKIIPDPRAWDLVSIALAVAAADVGVLRDTSPDGWTREIQLATAVTDPAFWASNKGLLEQQLRFLTTDRWSLSFLDNGLALVKPTEPVIPDEDSVTLLSGGLDSLVGALDIVNAGKKPLACSQVVAGDKDKQAKFAAGVGGGLRHLQLNHATTTPGKSERSQRARSLVFFAYGVLAATALERYHAGDEVVLYVCENGLISVNPPLSDARLGSLSTRTTHPAFLAMFQSLLTAADLRVRLVNPYWCKTKGEMLAECSNQDYLTKHAHTTTSCGRYARFKYRHCGRCLPCQIRRAAFLRWGVRDRTEYVYSDLGREGGDHSGFDDVRSAAMALAEIQAEGVDAWVGAALSSSLIPDAAPYTDVVSRGMQELGHLHEVLNIQ